MNLMSVTIQNSRTFPPHPEMSRQQAAAQTRPSDRRRVSYARRSDGAGSSGVMVIDGVHAESTTDTKTAPGTSRPTRERGQNARDIFNYKFEMRLIGGRII